MRNIFRGYVEVPLPQDDDALPKWNAVKHADIAGTYSASWQSIGEMNAIVNATVQYTDDPDDHWQTAATTLAIGRGDCEDFATLKFGILRHINVVACLVLAEIARMPSNWQHALLVVELNGVRRVLDNKFDHLIDPTDYINLIPKKGFTIDDAFMFSKQFTLREVISNRTVV